MNRMKRKIARVSPLSHFFPSSELKYMMINKDEEQDTKHKIEHVQKMISSHQQQEQEFVIHYHDQTACKIVVVGYESHQTTLCEAPKGPVYSPSLQQHPTATKVKIPKSQAEAKNEHPCSQVKKHLNSTCKK